MFEGATNWDCLCDKMSNIANQAIDVQDHAEMVLDGLVGEDKREAFPDVELPMSDLSCFQHINETAGIIMDRLEIIEKILNDIHNGPDVDNLPRRPEPHK